MVWLTARHNQSLSLLRSETEWEFKRKENSEQDFLSWSSGSNLSFCSPSSCLIYFCFSQKLPTFPRMTLERVNEHAVSFSCVFFERRSSNPCNPGEEKSGFTAFKVQHGCIAFWVMEAALQRKVVSEPDLWGSLEVKPLALWLWGDFTRNLMLAHCKWSAVEMLVMLYISVSILTIK